MFEVIFGLVCVAAVLLYALRDFRRSRVPGSVAFFHPFATAGGGGEFVLWSALAALAEARPGVSLVVYVGFSLRATSPASAVDAAARAFGFSPATAAQLHARVRFVQVATAPLAFRPWPHATLALQLLFGAVAGAEALCRYLPDVFVDTAGAAGTLPVARLFGACRCVAAYVHYPAISAEMMRDATRTSPAKSRYYALLTAAYGAAGGAAHVAMANGSWTAGHIGATWRGVRPRVVFPPCSAVVSAEECSKGSAAAAAAAAPITVVSIGQFRPEKRHIEQVRALHRMLLAHPEHWGRVRLVLVGSVRGAEDAARRDAVVRFAAERGLIASGTVVVPENVDAAEKRALLCQAAIGLHAMRDEHFGICVVEYMAHGAVPLAHNSAGPRMDIVVPALTAADVGPGAEADVGLGGDAVGMLADTELEYAECLHALISRPELRQAMAKRASARAELFTPEKFRNGFLEALDPYLNH